LKKGGLTILEDDPTIYPQYLPLSNDLLGSVIAEWATQCFRWVNMLFTIETIKEAVNLLNKRTLREEIKKDIMGFP
jgi:hypothetical protein